MEIIERIGKMDLNSSGSIEEVLYHTLADACSQDPIKVKSAEQKLAEWEVQKNFYTSLFNFVSNYNVNSDVRYMSSILFKSGVDKYWRKTQPNCINAEEKVALKAELIRNFKEPQNQIAVQLAVIISKVARLDCPNEWPELIPRLLECVGTNDELEQKRSLQVLVQVVKALSTKRLHHDRLMFEQFTNNLYEFILNLWNGFTMMYFQNVQELASVEVCMGNLEKALLTLRILRKLTIHGFYKPKQSVKCMMFIKVIFERLKDLLECRIRIKSAPFNDASLLEKHEKFILKHMKILTEFQEYHRVAFFEFAPVVLEFSFNYVFYEGANLLFEDNKITLPNFTIHCLNLLKGYLLNTGSQIYSSEPLESEVNLADILKEFFTQERLSFIIDKLLMHYFLLTPADIEQWDEDPEIYVGDEGGDSWKYNLRACTEAFYMSLFQKFNPILCSQLVVYIQKSQSIQLTQLSGINDVLIKESIYNAVGLVAFHLFDDVDFNEWFTKQLLDELKIKEPNYRILRKRIIWLIGQWTGVNFSKTLRPAVYAACLDLLAPSEDIVVRLTASKTLKTILDDFDFCAEQFLEYLEPSFSLLFDVLKEAKECDTKMNILYVMSFIVEKMSMSIKIQADNLVMYLPLLWYEGVEHNMLRCAIISALLQIIKAIYELPETITSFVYNVISISTNVNDPATIYLLDEGLELWLIVTNYAPVANDALLQLCDNIIPIIGVHFILEKSTINLKTCLFIMQSYMLLCPELYLQKYGKQMIDQLLYLIKDIRPEGIVMICKLFIVILRIQPEYGVELLKPAIVDIMRCLLNDSDYLSVKQIYLQVATRYLLANQHAFSQVLEELQIEDSLQKFLTIWLNTMPSVANHENKKLLALSLCSLLTVGNDIIQDSFSAIIINVYETLCDIMKADVEGGEEVDSLVLHDVNDLESNDMYDMEDCEYKSPHYDRYRNMCMKDPVHKVELKQYLQSQLVALKKLVGDEKYEKMMSTVDITIHKLLFNYVNTLVTIA